MFRYQAEKTFEERLQETRKVTQKWPGRVPIIIEPVKETQRAKLNKPKILCVGGCTVQHFLGVIRKKMKLPKDSALFLFLNGTELITGDSIIGELYQSKKADDGYLYFKASEQEVMG